MTLYTSGDWKVDPNKDITFPLVDWILKLFPVLKNKEIDNCLAIEGFCALHVVDDLPKHIVSFGNESNCHFVSYKNNQISHNPISNTKRIEL